MARQKGTVRWFDDTKGYGFIGPEGGEKDVFVHYTGITEQRGRKSLTDGEPVEFELGESDTGRPQAVNVRRVAQAAA